jgi:hypothetical protein
MCSPAGEPTLGDGFRPVPTIFCASMSAVLENAATSRERAVLNFQRERLDIGSAQP